MNVTYSGEVTSNGILPTQTSGGGTNFWDPNATYQSSLVENGPGSAGNTDIIALAGQNTSPITNTISFSSPVTNPVMAVVSLGQVGLAVTYTFNQDFSILSSGVGHFAVDGAGTLFRDGVGQLRGAGGNGVILFSGTFSSISFTASPAEGWHGFQVGVVPSPSAAAMLGLGGLVAARRRR